MTKSRNGWTAIYPVEDLEERNERLAAAFARIPLFPNVENSRTLQAYVEGDKLGSVVCFPRATLDLIAERILELSEIVRQTALIEEFPQPEEGA